MNQIVDGLHVAGADSGKGKKTALLLHGWGVDHASILPLKNALKGYRIIAPDLPGFGGSQSPPEAWSALDYAHFITRLLEKMSAQSIDVVIGHSFGGRIALELCGNGLLQPKKLIMLGSHGLPEPASVQRRLSALLAKTGKLLAKPLPERQKERLRRRLYKLVGAGDYLDNQNLRETFLKVIKQDASTIAPHITMPTLLIYGADDTQTPPSYFGTRFNELIPNSTLAIIEDAGHYVHIDKPKQVNDYIKEFLQ